MKHNNHTYYRIFFLAVVLLFCGCSVPPPKSTIERVIVSHFESGPYKVLDIVIGNISPIPEREKQYMGTEGYVVNVPSITLEFLRDVGEPWNYKKGHYMTFNDGTIRIKKRSGKNTEWDIVEITGIPVL